MDISADEQKRRELRRMRRLATGLLGLVAAVFAVSLWLQPRFPALAFVRAFAEAAMVGALADWFAVTALFRHPLGLPIPHTAIIARRKDSLGESVGRFVQENFLAPDVLVGRLRAVQAVERVGQLLSRDAVSSQVARQVSMLIDGALDVVNDREIQDLIERSVAAQIDKVQPSPFLGRLLAAVLKGERLHELVSEVMHLSAQLLEENQDMLRERIQRETPWWMPSAFDRAIAERIFAAINTAIQEINGDPEHPFYTRFEAVLARFIQRLQHDPETIARGEALKQELLSNRFVRDVSASLWLDIKAFLKEQSSRDDSALQLAIARSVRQFGASVTGDPELAQKVQGWVEQLVVYLSREYRGQFAQLVAYTVSRWDTESTVEKLELQVGKDLQYIRINGTIVGGLAGLAIYIFSRLIGA